MVLCYHKDTKVLHCTKKLAKGKEIMKKLIALLLALAMVLSLAACGGNASEEKPAEPTQPAVVEDEAQEQLENKENIDNTVVRESVAIAYQSVTSLAPWGTNNNVPGNYEVYEMLYECDADGLYPVLADASYEGSYLPGADHEAGTGVYTVKIRDSIYDHKGNHVTAADVAYSYMYQYQNETTSGWQDLISVEAADDTTVVFTFAKEQNGVGQMLNILARCFIVDEESHKASASGLATEMCGTGPYMMKDYVSGSQLTLVKNENYWQVKAGLTPRQEQQANVNTIVYKFIDEAAQRVVALKTGEVDYVNDMKADGLADFADGGEFADKFNVYSYTAKFVYYLVPNCHPDGLLGDLNMRLAVLNAVDQDGLITALGGTNQRIKGYVSYYSAFYDAKWIDFESTPTYNNRTAVDMDAVKGYLDAAGYKGETVKLLTTAGNTAAEIVAAQLNAAGINCELKALDMSSYRAAMADPTAWDLDMGMMAGSEMATVWLHQYSYANMDGKQTTNYIVDDEWEALLNLIQTEEGHTAENMQKWWDHCAANAYGMGLYNGTMFDIVPADMTYVCQGDKQVPLPGACTYEAK